MTFEEEMEQLRGSARVEAAARDIAFAHSLTLAEAAIRLGADPALIPRATAGDVASAPQSAVTDTDESPASDGNSR